MFFSKTEKFQAGFLLHLSEKWFCVFGQLFFLISFVVSQFGC